MLPRVSELAWVSALGDTGQPSDLGEASHPVLQKTRM